MKVFIFAGQGTQHPKMGKELFPSFREECKQASKVLGYSIEELCLHDPENKLSETEYAQPAIYFVNALKYLQYKKKGEIPDLVSGHSLGEYNALHAAGMIELFEGLHIIKKRGEEMGKIRNGGMMAVIGQPVDQIQLYLLENNFSGIDFANFNSKKQTVVSGPITELNKAQSLLEEKGYRCVLLPVSGPFHSRYMDPARISFAEYLINVPFRENQIPFISPTTTEPVESSFLLETLSSQLVKPVYWVETIEKIGMMGSVDFIEISPGDEVLTRLISQILF